MHRALREAEGYEYRCCIQSNANANVYVVVSSVDKIL